MKCNRQSHESYNSCRYKGTYEIKSIHYWSCVRKSPVIELICYFQEILASTTIYFRYTLQEKNRICTSWRQNQNLYYRPITHSLTVSLTHESHPLTNLTHESHSRISLTNESHSLSNLTHESFIHEYLTHEYLTHESLTHESLTHESHSLTNLTHESHSRISLTHESHSRISLTNESHSLSNLTHEYLIHEYLTHEYLTHESLTHESLTHESHESHSRISFTNFTHSRISLMNLIHEFLSDTLISKVWNFPCSRQSHESYNQCLHIHADVKEHIRLNPYITDPVYGNLL